MNLKVFYWYVTITIAAPRWLRGEGIVAEEDEEEDNGSDSAEKSRERGEELCESDRLLDGEVLP